MRNLTTAIIVQSPHLPRDGLQQRQLHQDQPLHFMDIIESPAGGLRFDAVAISAARHFVAAAVQYVHQSAVYRVFGDSFARRFEMPAVDVLQPLKTPVHLLSAVFENEATLSGTARVHKNLFVDQLRIGCPDKTESSSFAANASHLDTAPEFAERLFLTYGDQLTAARIRGVKFGQQNARRAFDRREWLLGPPVWFHTLQAVLHLIIRSHWEPLEHGQFSRATLIHDITYLNRSGISRESPKYHLMQPLVTQGFRARALALFYRTM